VIASTRPVPASSQVALGVGVPSARARSRSAVMWIISCRAMSPRSARTSAGRPSRQRFSPSTARASAGDASDSSAMILRSAGSVITWALNRANHVGAPSSRRYVVLGRTRQATQSRSPASSPVASTSSARSRSIGPVCLRTIARTRSTFVPKW